MLLINKPILFLILIVIVSHAQTTSLLPIGARSNALGGTGYVTANDGTALFFNPAILGIQNTRWVGGEAQYFREPQIYDIVKSYYALVYQPKKLDRIGFSVYLNYLKSWENSSFDPYGNVVDSWHYYDFSTAGGIGYCFQKNEILAISIGLTVKYYRTGSIYLNKKEDDHSYTFGWDLGYLFEFFKRVRLATVIKNIGPDIKTIENDTIASEYDQPSLFAAGIGYIDNFYKGKLRAVSIASEFSYSQTINKNNIKPDDRILSTGAELVFLNTIPIRIGLSEKLSTNNSNVITTISSGTGISLFNHFCFDIFWSTDDDKNKEDDPHFGFSISITRLLNWDKADKKWWLRY